MISAINIAAGIAIFTVRVTISNGFHPLSYRCQYSRTLLLVFAIHLKYTVMNASFPIIVYATYSLSRFAEFHYGQTWRTQRYHFVFRIDIMETMPDHVHFLFQCDPQQRMYKAVK